MSQVAEVLKKALAALGPNGENWTKGYMSHHAPQCCAVLAFYRIEPESDDETIDSALTLINNAIGINRPYQMEDDRIQDWNDADERTWPEIKSAYERAIELAEREPQKP